MFELSRSDRSEPTRRSFLRRAVPAVAVPATALLATRAHAGGLGQGYEEIGSLFAEIRGDENRHVQAIVAALGSQARPRPTYQNLEQPSLKQLIAVSQTLENTGSGAYLGAAPAIDSRSILAAAGSIALIEGRHAGWLNSLENDPLTHNVLRKNPSFETPLTADQVAKLAGPFIKSLNGGPPLTYSTTPSPSNDIAILNFALALEYLEAEFYNVNVRRFFSNS